MQIQTVAGKKSPTKLQNPSSAEGNWTTFGDILRKSDDSIANKYPSEQHGATDEGNDQTTPW